MLCHIAYASNTYNCLIHFDSKIISLRKIQKTLKDIIKYLTVKQISICQTLYHYIARFEKVGEYIVYRFDIDIVHPCQVPKL